MPLRGSLDEANLLIDHESQSVRNVGFVGHHRIGEELSKADVALFEQMCRRGKGKVSRIQVQDMVKDLFRVRGKYFWSVRVILMYGLSSSPL